MAVDPQITSTSRLLLQSVLDARCLISTGTRRDLDEALSRSVKAVGYAKHLTQLLEARKQK